MHNKKTPSIFDVFKNGLEENKADKLVLPIQETYRQDEVKEDKVEEVKLVEFNKAKDLNSVIGGFLKNIIEDEKFNKYIEVVKEDEKRLDEFISPDKSEIMKDGSELIVLRQWNSFTPILPDKDIENKGGGYFIRHFSSGIVIDPGYNFIEHFFNAGFKIDDIDYVFITHAHDDHTGQLEAILSLLFKRNKKFWKTDKINEVHKVKLFLNVGTFVKFSHVLDLNNKKSNIDRVVVLNEHQKYEINDMIELYTTKVKHNEVITNEYSLGFVFKLTDPSGETCNLRFTGDTGWSSSIEEENEKFLGSNQIDYIDILVLHLGSIEDSELKYDFDKSFDENSHCLYPNHLGLIGAVAMIYKNKARLSIISEFGFELDEMRVKVSELIRKELNPLKVLPGDVNMRIDLYKSQIRCSFLKKYYDPDKIEPHRNNAGKLVYLSKDALEQPKVNVNIPSFVEKDVEVF